MQNVQRGVCHVGLVLGKGRKMCSVLHKDKNSILGEL